MSTSKDRAMFIKIYMAKVYARVKWSFFKNVFLAFGFILEWVSWILSCVTSPSFSILHNVEPFELFGTSRGLR